MDLDEIQPQQSAGGIALGWSEQDVISTLGEQYNREIGEEGDVYLGYEGLRIGCTFWNSEDLRLGWISIERPTARLADTALIGMSKMETRQFIASVLQTTIDEVDGVQHSDGQVQEWIDVDSHELAFWFRDDALYLIDVMCGWIDGETPNWPAN